MTKTTPRAGWRTWRSWACEYKRHNSCTRRARVVRGEAQLCRCPCHYVMPGDEEIAYFNQTKRWRADQRPIAEIDAGSPVPPAPVADPEG